MFKKKKYLSIYLQESHYIEIDSINNQIILINTKTQEKNINSLDFLKSHIQLLFENIKTRTDTTFSIPLVEEILRSLQVNESLVKKSNNKNKSDIKTEILFNNIISQAGFSIKSDIINSSTLLNSSSATAFQYKISNISANQIEEINNIKTKSKIKDRIKSILRNNGNIVFHKIKHDIFKYNISMIDSKMDFILADLLLQFFSSNLRTFEELSNSHNEYKLKKFLLAILLGIFPSKKWNGYYESHGLILVSNKGELSCMYITEEEYMSNYLFLNTKLDTPSSSRHDFGYIYFENNELYIDLNLQIRFK